MLRASATNRGPQKLCGDGLTTRHLIFRLPTGRFTHQRELGRAIHVSPRRELDLPLTIAASVEPCHASRRVETRRPSEVWAALASVLAQRPVMRVSRDGGRSYPASRQRPLAQRLPSQPAAVPTWQADGTTCLLVCDLDIKLGDVAADCAELMAAIETVGGRALVDQSPTGGRHVYLLLAAPVTKPDVDALMDGLAAHFRSLDPQPMRSIVSGLIRPPGSPHKRGGHQVLLTEWDEALDIVEHRNPVGVLTRLTAKFPAPKLMVKDSHQPDRTTGPEQPLTGRWAAIARDGDTSGYPSPSEARQAVVWGCVASGWSLTQLAQRLQSGQMPGLASLYQRYAPHQRHQALSRDWHNATRFEETRSQSKERSKTHVCNTRGQETHGGTPSPSVNSASSDYRDVRAWVTAMRWAEQHRSMEPSSVLVLRALAQAAQREGHLGVAVGVRSLALATHLDPATVSRHLHLLRSQQDPLIVRVGPAKGIEADAYALVIPDVLAQLVERTPWERGRVRALHPVFRALGHSAGFVFEALSTARGPLQLLEVAARTPWWSLSAVRDAMRTLAGWNLAVLTSDGWILGPESPDTVAAITGADEEHQEVVKTYRTQRRAWWAWLRRRHTVREPIEPPPDDEFNPPPPDDWNADWEPPPLHEAMFAQAEELIMSALGATPLVSTARCG